MTDSMIAIEIAGYGGPEVLQPTRRTVPQPAAGEVLIEVAAAGVNRPDVLQRQGGYRPPPGASDIPGLEVAGRIIAVGEAASPWRVGDKVTALLAGGGYAEYCAAPALQCLPIPAGLDWVQAAALPETFFTVWTNVFDRGRLKTGESFLVHGGSSGIGTTAIQLARALGARVFTTAGSPEKCEACQRLGAERAIDHRREDFVAIIEQATAGKGVDVILDMVGGSYINRNLKILALEGRLVQIAFLEGSKAEIDLGSVMMRRQTVTGSTLRPRSVAEKGAIAQSLREKVWPLIEAGKIAPVVYKTLPLPEAAEAHRLMESSRHIGKIVLTTERCVN
jgi:putative PIG3 family NAD(P)H quinone oxidoreductase